MTMPDIIEPETLAEQFIDLGIDSNIEVRDQNILLKHISASSRNIKNASTTWVDLIIVPATIVSISLTINLL